MKKIFKGISLFAIAIAFIFGTGILIKADASVTTFVHDGVTYNYKTSSYELPQTEADKMIKENGDLVAPKNDVAPIGYPHFVGYNNATHKAIYSDKAQPKSLSKSSVGNTIKSVGTWKVGSYWGTKMRDANGTVFYCLDRGKNYPMGKFTFVRSDSLAIRKALSWAYPKVNATNGEGKSSLALWMGRNQFTDNSTNRALIGSYYNVAKGYKGTIAENNKTFKISGSLNNSTKYSGIPNQNVTQAISITGTSNYAIDTANYKKLTDKGVYPYKYHKTNKTWSRMSVNTWHSPSTYTHIRLATTNLLFSGTISGVELRTNVSSSVGYMWDNGKSGDQRLANYTPISNEGKASISTVFKTLGGKYAYSKQEDRRDLFGENAKDKDGNIIFNTVDGKYKYVEEDGLINAINYETKEEMDLNNSYSQPIKYQSPILNPIMITVDKTDADGNKIQKVDEITGLPVFEVDGITPVYETEQVQKKTDDGQLMYEAVKVDGVIQYQEVISATNNPTLKGMLAQKFIAVPFGVYDAITNKLVQNTTSSANGEVSGELKEGKYYLKELSTLEGLKLDETKYYFEIKTGQTTKINNGKVITNYETTGQLNILKIDKDFKERMIAGAQFLVFQLDKNGNYNIDEPYSYLESDFDGKISTTLPIGDYIFKEIKAPKGYVLDSSIEYSVTISDGATEELSIENEQEKEKFEVDKVDPQGKKIPNTILGIYTRDIDGNVKLIDKVTTTSKTYNFNGRYDQNEIGIGELKAADGYKLDKTIRWFKIDLNGQVNKVVLVNQRIKYTAITGYELNFNILELFR